MATVAVGAGLLVTPPAHAAGGVSCTFDAKGGVMRVELTGFESTAVFRRSMDERLLVNADLCTSAKGVIADLSNIRTVVVLGDESAQTVQLDLNGGSLGPGRGNEPGGSDEIEFDLRLGPGRDYVEIEASDAGSYVRAGTKDGWNLINLNPAERRGVDADVRLRSVNAVGLVGAMSDDRFIGSGGRATGKPFARPLAMIDFVGGDDVLVGGSAPDEIGDGANGDVDVVRGGAGDDNLSVYEGDPTIDVIDGGRGLDRCQYDVTDLFASCERKPLN